MSKKSSRRFLLRNLSHLVKKVFTSPPRTRYCMCGSRALSQSAGAFFHRATMLQSPMISTNHRACCDGIVQTGAFSSYCAHMFLIVLDIGRHPNVQSSKTDQHGTAIHITTGIAQPKWDATSAHSKRRELTPSPVILKYWRFKSTLW